MCDFYTIITHKNGRTFMVQKYIYNLVSFWSFPLSGTGKWLWSESGQISVKKGQYLRIIYIESNLIFCRKKNWSFHKVLDHQILEELINLKLKSSFLCLFQFNLFYGKINDFLYIYISFLYYSYICGCY